MRNLLQQTLDDALYPDVYSFWQRKSGADVDEYVVYTLSGDSAESHADNQPLAKNADVTVRYYYRASKLNTYDGRQAVEAREEQIQQALEDAGFTIPFGKFDGGDIDDIGFYVTVFECEYWRVI
jgi:hypothetical protein